MAKKRKLKISVKITIIVLAVVMVGAFYALISRMLSEDPSLINDSVASYKTTINTYATRQGIGEYTELLEAIMMQESSGQGSDPMQSSECEFNEQYPKKHNAITSSDYSIEVGVKYFAKCLKQANVTNINEHSKLYLALQAYNYGVGYIDYANDNGGYSYENAVAFSNKCKQEQNLSVYGDSKYVYHVLRYYPNQTIVEEWLNTYH
ncbi:MAG: lysozyme family protein [Thomasclavelia sp.]|jgi:hypothetical protein|nr:lysozyme family protein [Thomasclavelia sp.]